MISVIQWLSRLRNHLSVGVALLSTLGGSKTMNIIRIKIICSWLLLVLFGLLLCFSWRHRFLWVALLCAASVILELIKPRRPPLPPRLKALLWLMAIVWALTVIFHGILFPYSAGLYLLGKVACLATAAPPFCYKVWLDYGAFRAVQHASAEPGAPPASVS